MIYNFDIDFFVIKLSKKVAIIRRIRFYNIDWGNIVGVKWNQFIFDDCFYSFSEKYNAMKIKSSISWSMSVIVHILDHSSFSCLVGTVIAFTYSIP